MAEVDSPDSVTIRDRIVDRTGWARRGLIRTWYRSLGYAFDRRYGIETNGVVVEDDLDGTGTNAVHATRYEPSPPGSIRHIVRAAGIEPAHFTFVDLGSGKGRAVIEALRLGFERAVGVEFSPTLHAASVQAVRRYKERAGTPTEVELLRMDAAEYPVTGGNLFVYLYHPFEEPVMKRVVETLEGALEEDPGREIVVGYLISNWARHLEGSKAFEGSAEGRYAGFAWDVFRSVGVGSRAAQQPLG